MDYKFKIGDKVIFGLDRGAKTRGTVLRFAVRRGNPAYKISQDEPRNSRPIGTVWTVAETLVEPAAYPRGVRVHAGIVSAASREAVEAAKTSGKALGICENDHAFLSTGSASVSIVTWPVFRAAVLAEARRHPDLACGILARTGFGPAPKRLPRDRSRRPRPLQRSRGGIPRAHGKRRVGARARSCSTKLLPASTPPRRTAPAAR